MFREDYIMREIRHFIQVLEQVLFKKKQGQVKEAQELITQTLNELLRESERDFSELSLSETFDVLCDQGQFNTEKALVIADLLFEQENTHEHSSKIRSLLIYKKAMEDPAAVIPLKALERVTELENSIPAEKLSAVQDLPG